MKYWIVALFVVISCEKSPIANPEKKGYPANFSGFLQDIRSTNTPFPFGTHCKSNELTVFGCEIGEKKIVSVCISADASKPSIAYRFGPRGAPELEFPSDPSTSLDAFSYYWYLRPFGCENEGLDENTLTFSRGTYQYSVYTRYVACAEETTSGIVVELLDGQHLQEIADMKCTRTSGSLLPFRFNPIVYCPDCRDPMKEETRKTK